MDFRPKNRRISLFKGVKTYKLWHIMAPIGYGRLVGFTGASRVVYVVAKKARQFSYKVWLMDKYKLVRCTLE